MTIYLATLFALTFCLGAVTGNGLTTQSQYQRARTQAKKQRSLNEQERSLNEKEQYLQVLYRALRERAETDEEDMRWETKRQSGMTISDYDPDEDVA